MEGIGRNLVAMILLGWEIGTGKRVEIPDTGHLAWFGQTQLSGKTTALEAIAFRGGLRAVAFITKQGEGGFLTGKMIPPYFSEPTNDEEQPLWRWVKSILEASQARRMSFEESWIIRCCEDPRPAKTLADVHTNIKALLHGEKAMKFNKKGKHVDKWIRKPVSGINAGVYTSLKAYFDIVMPQLARLPYTKKLSLGPGLNVMDLRDYAMETQALVIRSVMEWVYQHEKNVRVIVPEAQDFVPQGKNSPVKMACETLVRKAGANRNFMWLDSQDMAAVDKIMLRACSIVGIGVQTEGHEIDRSLASLFTPALRAVDIARLKIGEFFVRTPEAKVSKVYVQPAWCDSEVHAQEIAKGNLPVASLKEVLGAYKKSHKANTEPSSPAPQLLQIQTQDSPGEGDPKGDENDIQSDYLSGDRASDSIHRSLAEDVCQSETSSEKESVDDSIRGASETGEEKMWREKYEALHAEHQALIEAHDALAERVRELTEGYEARLGRSAEALTKHMESQSPSIDTKIEHGVAIPSNGSLSSEAKETIYRYIIERAKKEPGVLEVLLKKPELRVKVEVSTLTVNGDTLRGQLALLIKKGFFDVPKNGNTAFKEIVRLGRKVAKPNVYRELDGLAELGFLTKEDGGYQSVAEMKAQVQKA